MNIIKMTMVYKPLFNSVGHCLSYYSFNNPARQKSINLLDTETSSKRNYLPFESENPHLIWARILKGIQKVKKFHSKKAIKAWEICSIGENFIKLTPKDAAIVLHTTERTVYRWLAAIQEDLEEEFIKRDLIQRKEKLSDYRDS